MASLQWNEHIRVVVSEMSWKQQIACSNAFLAWVNTESAQQDAFTRQVAIITLLILHSRITFYRDDTLLTDGTHDIGDGVMLALPLTKDGIDNLPASLVDFMVKAVQKENAHTLENFFAGVTAMRTTIPAP